MNLKTYDAIAHREGTGWVVDVPELETAGQPTNFIGILLAATETISRATGLEPGNFGVRLVI